MPTIFSGPRTGVPATRTSPRVGGLSPVASFMNVDLPHPDGPTIATNSPAAMVRSMSWTAFAASP